MMKLYSGDLSPFSARVRMQIYAKGITDIAIELPPHFGMPKFRDTAPIGRIPVLDVDGDLIPESAVIAEYLEEIYPEPSLLGATPRETAHIRTIARLGDMPMPRSRIVKEKRATFAATPAQDALRPGVKTHWNNLFLAGDWTQTGLPATIEGAIRSGDRAAEFA